MNKRKMAIGSTAITISFAVAPEILFAIVLSEIHGLLLILTIGLLVSELIKKHEEAIM